MVIREANADEINNIMIFYDMMCKELNKASFLPEGNKGGFPSKDYTIYSTESSAPLSPLPPA